MPFDGIKLTSDSRLLLRVVEILDEVGWCQGAGSNAAGNLCIVTAIARAHREMGNPPTSVHRDLLDGNIVAYNDAPGRTYDEVRTALLDAAFRAFS